MSKVMQRPKSDCYIPGRKDPAFSETNSHGKTVLPQTATRNRRLHARQFVVKDLLYDVVVSVRAHRSFCIKIAYERFLSCPFGSGYRLSRAGRQRTRDVSSSDWRIHRDAGRRIDSSLP